MALDFPGHADAMRRTLEIAERCNVTMELGRVLLPKFPMPDGRDAFDYLVELCEQGSSAATTRSRRSSRSACSSSSRRSRRWGSRTTSSSSGTSSTLRSRTASRRPGPRVGGRLARRLRARHHRRRPDALRAPLRALPQPGPQGPAGHGHRLRRGRPRPGHQLRLREVRSRPRRADHHVRDDGRARRRARRRPRARDPVRLGRQDREADPGGPGPDARRVPQAGRRAAPAYDARPVDEGDRRPRQAARGARRARTRSTRPAS